MPKTTEKEKTPKKIEKKYYDVIVETTVPATITFRILAEDENEAIRLSEKSTTPIKFTPFIGRRRNIKAVVRDAGSSLIRTIKFFRV